MLAGGGFRCLSELVDYLLFLRDDADQPFDVFGCLGLTRHLLIAK